jgi:hypothetical protein
MSLTIIWNFPALWRFYRLPRHEAELVDAAVIAFAETGEGHIEWVAPHHRLRAGCYGAVLAIDLKVRTVTVLRIYRMRL